MICECGADTGATCGYSVIKTDRNGDIVYAVCVHGRVIVNNLPKDYQDEDEGE